MRKYRGSVIAWACICMAAEVIQKKKICRDSPLWFNCSLIPGELAKKCGMDLAKIIKDGGVKNLATYKKFSQPQYFNIAPSCT